ncbi:hypothetical protein AB4344_28835, partial [Vibrio breoganii]
QIDPILKLRFGFQAQFLFLAQFLFQAARLTLSLSFYPPLPCTQGDTDNLNITSSAGVISP